MAAFCFRYPAGIIINLARPFQTSENAVGRITHQCWIASKFNHRFLNIIHGKAHIMQIVIFRAMRIA
jgi:hypothetical protein